MKNKIQTGIWIDGSKAIIISFSEGEKTVTEIEAEIDNPKYHEKEGDKGTFVGTHHVNKEKNFEERRRNQTEAFLEEVLDSLVNTDEIYIFGPGEIKVQLKKKIINNKNRIKGKLMAMDTADYISLNQMVAQTKEFYNI